MAPFNDEGRKKSNATQRKRYGKDYSAEMRRRASMRKTFAPGNGGFRWMKEHDPERFAKIIADREKKRKDGQNSTIPG